MIAYLKGQVLAKINSQIILETNNIGYLVALSENLLAEIKSGDDLDVYIHHHIKEEASDLYGFKNLEDLELFELLLSISGVGPKTALGVFSVALASDIKEAISRGDSGLLTKVSGIGRKTAERIVLELREKIAQLNFYSKLSGEKSVVTGDEIDALMALGYSLSQAREALNSIDPTLKDSGARLKAALKGLGRNR